MFAKTKNENLCSYDGREVEMRFHFFINDGGDVAKTNRRLFAVVDNINISHADYLDGLPASVIF